ncbi:MAG: hypothetical protein ABI330_18675 [Caldimonas sp.]|nr:hypothetical protein [Pseudomonadota bacterium]MDQ2927133.1 hypothetical protein [Pseudomonadota bacterium]
MKTKFGWGRALVTLFLLALLALVAVLAVAWVALPLDHTTITVDGETVALSGLGGWHAGAVILVAALAVLIGLIVAALAVVFAFALAALGVVVALVAVLASLALVASPFLFIGWLIWLLVRPATRATAAA